MLSLPHTSTKNTHRMNTHLDSKKKTNYNKEQQEVIKNCAVNRENCEKKAKSFNIDTELYFRLFSPCISKVGLFAIKFCKSQINKYADLNNVLDFRTFRKCGTLWICDLRTLFVIADLKLP
jgi:hypothetical protein